MKKNLISITSSVGLVYFCLGSEFCFGSATWMKQFCSFSETPVFFLSFFGGLWKLSIAFLGIQWNWQVVLGLLDTAIVLRGLKSLIFDFLANRQVEILELADLEKQCSLARIRLTLAQHDPSAVAVAGKSSALPFAAWQNQATGKMLKLLSMWASDWDAYQQVNNCLTGICWWMH